MSLLLISFRQRIFLQDRTFEADGRIVTSYCLLITLLGFGPYLIVLPTARDSRRAKAESPILFCVCVTFE